MLDNKVDTFEPETIQVLKELIAERHPNTDEDLLAVVEAAKKADDKIKAQKAQAKRDAEPNEYEVERAALNEMQAAYDKLQNTPSWRMQSEGVREKMIALRQDIQAQQQQVYNLERKNILSASGLETQLEMARLQYSELAEKLEFSNHVSEAERLELISKKRAIRELEDRIQKVR